MRVELERGDNVIKTIRTNETRSRKVTLGFRPSLYEKLQKIAHQKQVAPTNLITEWMEGYVKSNQNLVHEYDADHPEAD